MKIKGKKEVRKIKGALIGKPSEDSNSRRRE